MARAPRSRRESRGPRLRAGACRGRHLRLRRGPRIIAGAKMKQVLATFLAAIAIAITIASCGGGTDGTGAVPPPTVNVTSSGVMTKGSVILNGIHFDPAGASIV